MYDITEEANKIIESRWAYLDVLDDAIQKRWCYLDLLEKRIKFLGLKTTLQDVLQTYSDLDEIIRYCNKKD